MQASVDVALILWNPDVIELVSFVLSGEDLTSCGVEPSAGEERIAELIASSQPRVVVFDLHPPYDLSAATARRLFDRFPDCCFLVTSANASQALKKAPWLSACPMLQKPYQVDEIASMVNSLAMRARNRIIALSAGAV